MRLLAFITYSHIIKKTKDRNKKIFTTLLEKVFFTVAKNIILTEFLV